MSTNPTTLGRAYKEFQVIFINAFLIGTASGLRSLIGLAAVSWAVHLGILPLDHTWLTFLGYAFTPYILTLMAIGVGFLPTIPDWRRTRSRPISPCTTILERAYSGG